MPDNVLRTPATKTFTVALEKKELLAQAELKKESCRCPKLSFHKCCLKYLVQQK